LLLKQNILIPVEQFFNTCPIYLELKHQPRNFKGIFSDVDICSFKTFHRSL
jgi:hypothetical protein